jgi:hypothetical protein
MSFENPLHLPEKPNPFGFTEHEELWDRVSHERFLSIIESEQTNIHRAEVSSNTFGEFLFVTTSRDEGEKRIYVTFWGMGYHDYRERWIADEWFWTQDDTYPESLLGSLTLDEVQALIEERQAAIEPRVGQETQSRRGQLFEMLADLTDEDGAWAELDDLEGLLGDEDEW